ncbi:MAG: putative capsid protein [CRESS virus sp. ctf7a5]|uniref:Putative capsid protein n=1 Tax=CRESS virus sp. ctf7a5 TaxID=2656684 RepID=A0A5Q2W902_9VIRU|nr:MAG: putative capsid protein [CRESS virus sp. ctf7a5]
MEYVGGASGGVIGYISGGPWGAYSGASLGYAAGKNFTSNSQMERGRSRVRGLTPVRVRWGSTSRERKWKQHNLRAISRQSRSWSRGRELKHTRRRLGFKKRTVRGGGLRRPVVKYPKRSKVGFKRRKIRISKKFRRKVMKIVTGSKYKGFFMWNTYTNVTLATHKQTVHQAQCGFNVQDLQNPDLGKTTYPLFSPSVFSAVAETLWGSKAGPLSTATSYVTGVGNNEESNIFSFAKIPVINSWVRYCMKNNTSQVLEVKMFVCKPKVASFMYHGMNPAGQSTDLAFVYDPILDWEKAQSDLYADGVSRYDVLLQKQTLKGRLQTDGISTMDVDPRMFTWWNKKWKADVIKMKIMPGQCIEKIVKGPGDFVVDTFKLWRGALENNSSRTVENLRPAGWTFEEIQKYNRYVFWIVKPEIASVSTAVVGGVPSAIGVGRIPNPEGFTGAECFAVEQRMYYKLALPEKMGRWNEVAYQSNDIISENQMRDVFFCQYSKQDRANATGSIWQNTQTAGVDIFTQIQ